MVVQEFISLNKIRCINDSVKYEGINLCLCAVDTVHHVLYLDDAHPMITSRLLQIHLQPLPLSWCLLPLQDLNTTTATASA